MNVYVNARFLTQGVTGVQRHAREVVRALDRLLARGAAPAGAWTLLAPPGTRSTLDLASLGVRAVGRLGGHLWEQFELPRHAAGGVLVSLANTAPLRHPRQVVTIHDASVFAVPEAYSTAFRAWYRLLLPRLGRRATVVATDSRFSARELARRAGIPESRLRVVPLGAEHVLRAAPDGRVLDRLGLAGRRFVLAVSSRSPHKNLDLLRRVAPDLAASGCDVVLAGGANPRVFGRVGGGGGLVEAGYVGDGELRALYESAACFVYPSRYEGFGLPPLEAMACGCPVAASSAASLPEVCGDAALYFDPSDPGALAAAVRRILDDPGLAGELARRGRERSGRFTWERTACAMLELVGEAARDGAR